MTPQEIFNKSYWGVLTQGDLSQNPLIDPVCQYRSPNGLLACGVGQHVTPEIGRIWDTQPDSSIESIVATQPPLPGVEPWMATNIDLLEAIQGAHDSAQSLSDFSGNMAEVANRFSLEVSAQ